MLQAPFAAFLAILFLSCTLFADERVAIVRSDGLLVFLPETGGPGTYGTYLVPNELGRDQLDRFLFHGNPVQINFLPPAELPGGFALMDDKEKLETFFQVEERHLAKAFNQEIEFTDMEPSRFDGVDYLSGTVSFLDASGQQREIRITARTAGVGILHAGYQPENPATVSKARGIVDRLLRSFELVPRPLDADELTMRSKKAMN